MIDMTIREYERLYKRICNFYSSDKGCSKRCPFMFIPYACDGIPLASIETAIEIVLEWVKKHPENKTYAEDFMEKFPNCEKEKDGSPIFCRREVYGFDTLCTPGGKADCMLCWNEVMPEVTKNNVRNV